MTSRSGLDKKVILLAFIVLVGLLVSICVFPPQYVLAKKISDYTVHIMIGLLILGMMFLLFEENKLMFASFGYCGLLCLFLKGNVNQELKLPATSGTPSIVMAHFNVADVAGDYQELINQIIQSEADIISLNELTPDWDFVFQESLKDFYPYQSKVVRIDPFGLGILSKKPLTAVDTITFYEEDHPHLSVLYPMGLGRDVRIISSYFTPPLTRKEYGDYRVELLEMGQELGKMNQPLLVAGDYNLSDWSSELREFKFNSGLTSSRRDVSPRTNQGLKSWMDFPVDHILFNQALECTGFQSIVDSLGNSLGIVGKYQLSNSAR